jgi:hypothetical protein
MTGQPDPIPRRTAWVVLIDAAGRVLPFQAFGHDTGGRATGRPTWFTVDGGAEPGESAPDALALEVVDETGPPFDRSAGGRSVGGIVGSAGVVGVAREMPC